MTTGMPRRPTDPAARHMDPPIRPTLRGRRGQLVDTLGRRIGSGVIPPGTVIDPEAIGEEFGVSRTVVREAFQVLVSKGMLDPRPRVGTRVADPDNWDVLDHDVIVWQLTGPDAPKGFWHVLALGECIEPLAAHEAALQPHPELVEYLELLCAQMEAAALSDDLDAYNEADVAFHVQVLRASGSAVFERLSGTLTAVMEARNRLGMMPERMNSTTIDRHRVIAKAIGEGNAQLAKLLMHRLVVYPRPDSAANPASSPDRRPAQAWHSLGFGPERQRWSGNVTWLDHWR